MQAARAIKGCTSDGSLSPPTLHPCNPHVPPTSLHSHPPYLSFSWPFPIHPIIPIDSHPHPSLTALSPPPPITVSNRIAGLLVPTRPTGSLQPPHQPVLRWHYRHHRCRTPATCLLAPKALSALCRRPHPCAAGEGAARKPQCPGSGGPAAVPSSAAGRSIVVHSAPDRSSFYFPVAAATAPPRGLHSCPPAVTTGGVADALTPATSPVVLPQARRMRHHRSFRGHKLALYCLVSDGAGRRIVTGCDDYLVKVGSVECDL